MIIPDWLVGEWRNTGNAMSSRADNATAARRVSVLSRGNRGEMSDKLTPTELQQYHIYATACESDPELVSKVRKATRAEWEAREQAVRDTVGVPDDELSDDARVAYVALQRAEVRAYMSKEAE